MSLKLGDDLLSIGGIIMTRMNEACGAWVTELLEVGPNDTVLEVGFGPGVII
jgi:protein-L-isoaspartate O-methyltransferase